MPLTKTFSLENGEIQKTPYPNLANFTSTEHQVESLKDLYVVISAASQSGSCLIKGELNRPLVNESRAGSTDSHDSTEWLCFDLDGSQYKDPEKFMNDIGLGDVSYIYQYSASYGITNNNLGAHIFVLLDGQVKATILKLWLQDLNLSTPTLKESIGLTKSGATLSWPLDITTCQNDKIIYVAEPILGKGIKPKIKGHRINLVNKKIERLEVKRIGYRHGDAIQKEATTLRNGLRESLGLEPIRKKIRLVEGQPVQSGVSGITVTDGPLEARGFIYFNFNNGDSWAYYIDPANPKYIRNFKGEPWLMTEEVMPEYYAELVSKRKTPTQALDNNKIPFVCSDIYTASYWRGYIYPDTETYTIHPGRSEKLCEHFMLDHNMDLEHIPTWKLRFEPMNTTRINVEERFLNLWKPTPFYLNDLANKYSVDKWPTIKYVIHHICSYDSDAIRWLTNWIAFIIQFRKKTGVALIFQSVEGTGKGTLINHILRPLLGPEHVILKKQSDLMDKFNDWLKTSIIVGIDEAEIGALRDGEIIQSDLKNYITEPVLTIRAPFASAAPFENYTNFILNTNKKQGAILGTSDRRHTVFTYQNEKIKLSRKDIEEVIPSELEAFFSYLMHYNVDEQMARTPLANEARENLIELSKTTAQVLAEKIQAGDMSFLLEQMPDDHIIESTGPQSVKAAAYKDRVEEMINAIAHGEKEIKVSRDALFTIFDYCIGNMPVSPTKFSQFLNHKGIKIKSIRIDNNVKQGVLIEFHMKAEEAKKYLAGIKKRPMKLVKGDKK